MKTAFRFSIFLLTFMIGSVISTPNKFQHSDSNICSMKIKEIEQTETKLETKKVIEVNKPEIFNLKELKEAEETEGKFNKYMLETGEISNGEDVKAKSGEIWLGFFTKQNVLRPTKLKISYYKDHGLDWTKISTKDKENPLFLVKGLKTVKKGGIKTLFTGYNHEEYDEDHLPTSLKNGFLIEFNLGGTNYILHVKEGIDEEQQKIWVLLLETENQSQIISYITYSGEEAEVGSLFWVGDLDGDNKLDLYIDFYGYEKGYYTTGLFLSSEAEKGKLVKEFDYFMLGGC